MTYGTTINHCLTWGPLPTNKFGRIAQHVRNGKRKERFYYWRTSLGVLMSPDAFFIYVIKVFLQGFAISLVTNFMLLSSLHFALSLVLIRYHGTESSG